jgi:DNA-binding transcriptional ArsR family regulator
VGSAAQIPFLISIYTPGGNVSVSSVEAASNSSTQGTTGQLPSPKAVSHAAETETRDLLIPNPDKGAVGGASQIRPVPNQNIQTPLLTLSYVGSIPPLPPAGPETASPWAPAPPSTSAGRGPLGAAALGSSGSGPGAASDESGTSSTTTHRGAGHSHGFVAPGFSFTNFLPPLAPSSAAAAAGGALGTLVAVALYQRIRANKLLSHAARQRIADVVVARPGSTLVDIANATGLHYEVVAYHVGKLLAGGMLARGAEGKPMRLFSVGALGPRERVAYTTLQREGTRRLFDAVAGEPGLTKAALCRKLGVSAPTVTWHLERLEAAGLVNVAQEKIACTITPNLDVYRNVAPLLGVPAPDEVGVLVPASEPVESMPATRRTGAFLSGLIGSTL